mmetsp:Transcript_38520/g.123816  ORF Transcript_38520/g.123816 Transcript_38520/m.123816 type:complete len:84 (-) Transcript_38520:45-296(-)
MAAEDLEACRAAAQAAGGLLWATPAAEVSEAAAAAAAAAEASLGGAAVGAAAHPLRLAVTPEVAARLRALLNQRRRPAQRPVS